MGCDIHCYAERRDGPERPWTSADAWEEGTAWDMPISIFEVPLERRVYSERNYPLFSALAGVRNRAEISPVAMPRGLPGDTSPNVLAQSDLWGSDGHSRSWLTLAELMSYDWTQSIRERGICSMEDYQEWRRWRRDRGLLPRNFCQAITGPAVVVVEPDSEQFHLGTHVKFEASVVLSSVCVDFLANTMPRLWRLGAPEDVRLLFWFDN
jgi:hypothetical protein